MKKEDNFLDWLGSLADLGGDILSFTLMIVAISIYTLSDDVNGAIFIILLAIYLKPKGE